MRAITKSENLFILFSDKPVPSEVGCVKQAGTGYSSTATTISGETAYILTIYERDWEALKGDPLNEIPFMAHEVAVLKKLEATGQYGRISQPLFDRLRAAGMKMTVPSTKEECKTFPAFSSMYFESEGGTSFNGPPYRDDGSFRYM